MGLVREWGLGEKRAGKVAKKSALRLGGFAHHQAVCAPGLFVEKVPAAQSERPVKIVIGSVVRLEPVEIDPDVRKQFLGRFVVTLGRLDVQRSAIDGEQASVVSKFIAFGVPAEIVVIVEDQNAGIAAGALQEVVGRAQPADSSADDHQVVALVGVRDGGQINLAAVAQLMRRLEGSDMVAAHSGQRRRIVVRRLFRCKFLRRRPLRKKRGAGGASADSVDEIPPGDFPAHSKIAIVCVQNGPPALPGGYFCKIALFE